VALNQPTLRKAFTARQAEIVDLVAEGMADKEIARRLGVSVSTVRTHLQRLYKGIGARNRAQAVAEWLVTGSARVLQ
jgi:DNA-binding CsgD family transcriptional regulator